MLAFLLVLACGSEPPADPPPPPPSSSVLRTFVKGDARIGLIVASEAARADITHGPCKLHLRAGEDAHLWTLKSPDGTAKLHVTGDRLEVRDQGLCGEGIDLSGTYTLQP